MPAPADRLLNLLSKACLTLMALTAIGVIVLLLIVFGCPQALGCTTEDCSDNNPATGEVVAGNTVLVANAPFQAITHYEWRMGERLCARQPYRESYRALPDGSVLHRWTRPWFQPYASAECFPLQGWTNLYRVRACFGSICSPDSNPVEVVGERTCCFTMEGETPCTVGAPLCFGGQIVNYGEPS